MKENRGRILQAIYVLYKRWYQDGCSDHSDVIALGSFESWSKIIGNILAHAGINGFLGNREEFKQQLGSAGAQWETFLSDWFEKIGGRGISTKQFVSQYQDELTDSIPSELARALEPFSEHSKHTAVGKVFAAKAEARFGKAGLYLHPAGKSHGAQIWCVKVDDDSLLMPADNHIDDDGNYEPSDEQRTAPINDAAQPLSICCAEWEDPDFVCADWSIE